MTASDRGVVLRVGELFLKGQNRPMFEQALATRIKRVSSHYGELQLHRGQGRFFVTGGEPAGLVDELAKVFGLASVSPVRFVEKDLDVITRVAIELAREAQLAGAQSFRVTARRPDKRFPLPSPEINRVVGAALSQTTGLAVDLEQPDLVVGIEVGPKFCFLYTQVIEGTGGLPVGVAGEAVLLLSGGIDSPVAGYLMQKRGLRLIGVHFHSAPWTSAASQEKVRLLARQLATRQGPIELHMVPFGAAQETIREQTDESYRVILYRRFMLRIAERIANQRQAQALITGDSLGQVASQTVENLACIGEATNMLLLRPLLGFDKKEVVALARDIETFEISIQPHEDCCSLFVPRHPKVRGKAAQARRLERRLEVEAMVEHALQATSVEVITP